MDADVEATLQVDSYGERRKLVLEGGPTTHVIEARSGVPQLVYLEHARGDAATEGTLWIQGKHTAASEEGRALLAAYALVRE